MVNRLDYADYAKDLRPCNDNDWPPWNPPPVLAIHRDVVHQRVITSASAANTIQREVWESVGLDEKIVLLLSLSTSLGLGTHWRNAKL